MDYRVELAEHLKSRAMSRTLQLPSRWSSFNRVMGGDFPGPYNTKYHPWCKDILDCSAPYISCMKGAQLGVTEVCINRAFWTLDVKKRSALYVLPTRENAQTFSKARFNSALTLSPRLKSMFTDTDSVSLKQIGECSLYIRGSKSEAELVSIPVSALFLDERDRMNQRAVALAIRRLDGAIEKSIFELSTPTIPNHGIHDAYLAGSQEVFIFDCPHCSKAIHLTPECLVVCGEHWLDPDVKKSHLICPECKHKLEHNDKPEFLKTGRWVSTIANPDYERRSFYINQAYSFTIQPVTIARDTLKGKIDPATAQELDNSTWGKPHLGEGSKISDEMIHANIGVHTTQGARPRKAGDMFTTLGMDQGSECYYVVKSWEIERIGRDINNLAKPTIVDMGTFRDFEWHELDRLMREWLVFAAVIDADPEITQARSAAKRFEGYVFPCRYRAVKSPKEIQKNPDDTGIEILTVDRSFWITQTLSRYRTNRIVLPADVKPHFKEHIKALVRRYEKDADGNPYVTYVSTGDDHYAHASVYAEIALPIAMTRFSGASDISNFL